MINAKSTQIILRKLGKANCSKCTILGFMLNGANEELSELDVSVVDHDIEKEPDILKKYNKPSNPISSVPVLIVERNGLEVTRINGICNMEELFEIIEDAKLTK